MRCVVIISYLLQVCCIFGAVVNPRACDNDVIESRLTAYVLPDVVDNSYFDTYMCAASQHQYKSAAYSLICQMFVRLGYYESSIHYALQSLEHVLTYAPSLHCLAEAYYRMNDMLRASFFAEFSSSVDPSLLYMNSDQSFFEYLGRHHSDSVIISRPSRMPTNARLRSIWNSWNISSAMTPYGIYTQYATTTNGFENEVSLGAYHTYSAIYRMHLFLDDLQTLLSPLNEAPQQLCPRVTSLPAMRWPKHKKLIIYSRVEVAVVFGGNNVGFSDALNLLGVPNRVVSAISMVPVDDVYVMAWTSDMLVPAKLNFVMFNFEKRASVSDPDGIKVGFHTNKDGLDEAHYWHGFIVQASSYWESIPSNMEHWKDPVANADQLQSGPYFVPGFVPLQSVHLSCILQQASMRYVATTSDKISRKHQPIDILFFGNSNPHRDGVKEEFERMAKVMNWNVQFHMDYNLFGSKRDIMVDLAKIVLNLGNHPWPFGDMPRGNALNFHRIRPLLASGKVVLSERCGNDVDEAALKGVVIFANTSQLVMAADALLRDAALRHELENRAVRYMYEDTMTEKVTRGSKVTPSALSHLAEATNQLADKLWAGQTIHEAIASPENDALAWLEDSCSKVPEFLIIRQKLTRRPEEMTNLVRVHNASSYCDGLVSKPMLLEYLRRRAPSPLTLLEITPENSRVELLHPFGQHHYLNFPEDQIALSSSHETILQTYASILDAVKSFDVILMNNYHSAAAVSSLLKVVLPSLADDGVVVISNCRPTYEYEAQYPNLANAHYWTGDVYLVIIELLATRNIDIALGDFDWGVLFVKKRMNNNFHDYRNDNINFRKFGARLDDVIPSVMTIQDIHSWL